MTVTRMGLGADFGWDELGQGWSAFIHNGEYNQREQEALVWALSAAQVEEFEARMPVEVRVLPFSCELSIYSADVDKLPEDLLEVLREAAEAVGDRFEEIEKAALGE